MKFVNFESKIFEKDGKSIPYYRLHAIEEVNGSNYCRILKSSGELVLPDLKFGDEIEVYFDRFGRAVKVFKNGKS